MFVNNINYQKVESYSIKYNKAKELQMSRLPSILDTPHLEDFIEAVCSCLKFELGYGNAYEFKVYTFSNKIEFRFYSGEAEQARVTYSNSGEYTPARTYERKRGLTEKELAEFTNLALLIRCGDNTDPYYEFRYRKLCSYASNEEVQKVTDITG